MAGLLTCGSKLGRPSRPFGQWLSASLSAHSCGGSRGIGPEWTAPCSLFIPATSEVTREPSRNGYRLGGALVNEIRGEDAVILPRVLFFV